MKHIVSSKVTEARINNWLGQAKAIDVEPTWTERRQAISFGGHVYPIVNGQVFQCPHCGHYDPEWTSTEVLNFFEETLGIKPHEIEVEVTYKVVE